MPTTKGATEADLVPESDAGAEIANALVGALDLGPDVDGVSEAAVEMSTTASTLDSETSSERAEWLMRQANAARAGFLERRGLTKTAMKTDLRTGAKTRHTLVCRPHAESEAPSTWGPVLVRGMAAGDARERRCCANELVRALERSADPANERRVATALVVHLAVTEPEGTNTRSAALFAREMCEAMKYEIEVGPEVHAPKPVYPTGVNGPPLGLNAPLNGSTPGQSVLKKTERFDSDASKKFEADLREYSLAEFHAWWDMKVGFLCPLSAPSACAHRV